MTPTDLTVRTALLNVRMAQRDDDAGEATPDNAQDDESPFVATARDVITRREALLDALDE